MGAEELPEYSRNGEGNHEVVDRQKVIKTLLKPLMSLVTLTGGTVPVPTGTKYLVSFPTPFALTNNNSEIWGPAVNDSLHHLSMMSWNTLSKSVQI